VHQSLGHLAVNGIVTVTVTEIGTGIGSEIGIGHRCSGQQGTDLADSTDAATGS